MIEIKKEMVPVYSFEEFETKVLWKRDADMYNDQLRLEQQYEKPTMIRYVILTTNIDGDEELGYIEVEITRGSKIPVIRVRGINEQWYIFIEAAMISACSRLTCPVCGYQFDDVENATDQIEKTLIEFLNKF